MSSKKAIAIDGNCLMYRCFYATFKQLEYYQKHNLKPLNVFNLFVYSILKLINTKNYDYGIIAFDHSKHTFRSEKYDKYKEGRKPMPEPLASHYEADDIIGSFAKLMNKNNVEVEIYSSDRDMLQLVNDLTSVMLLKSGVSVVDEFNKMNFSEKFMGLKPDQITDFKGMAGDNSDHLKGIEGIGPKTAANMLLKYGNIDNIYIHLDELPPKTKVCLLQNKQQAMDCKELATIYKDLFNERVLEDFNLRTILYDDLYKFADDNNLNQLKNYIKKIEKLF